MGGTYPRVFPKLVLVCTMPLSDGEPFGSGLPWVPGLRCGLVCTMEVRCGLPGGILLGLRCGETGCMLSDDTDSVAVDEFDAFI